MVQVMGVERAKWEEWEISYVSACEIAELDMIEVGIDSVQKKKCHYLHCREGKWGVNILRWERWVYVSQ